MGEEADLIGRTIASRFRLTRCIGKGGMATVFAASQDAEPRQVAIKMMKRELTRDRTVLKRFKREAKAASRLQHNNTIRVFEHGVDGDDAYIVMELARGKDLLQCLAEQRPMHQGRAVNIVSQVCAALAAAHGLGIVHRDLKPENIMIVPSAAAPLGELVKVLDFGIAKILDNPAANSPAADGDDAPATITKSALTRVGTIVGTPAYMSPEQCRGGEIDGRSDVYACGVLLYQLITGQVPFLGETPLHTAMRHIHAPPKPPREHRPDVDQAVEAAILKALSKWPADRQQSADELRSELQAALKELPVYRTGSTSAATKAADGADERSETPIIPSSTDPAAQAPRGTVDQTQHAIARLGAPLIAQLKYAPQGETKKETSSDDAPSAAERPTNRSIRKAPPPEPQADPDDDDDDDDVRTRIKPEGSVIPEPPRPRAPASLDPRAESAAASTLKRRPRTESITEPRRNPIIRTAIMEPVAPVAAAAKAAEPKAPPSEAVDDDDDDDRPTALKQPQELAALLADPLKSIPKPRAADAPAINLDAFKETLPARGSNGAGPADEASNAEGRAPGQRGTLRMQRDLAAQNGAAAIAPPAEASLLPSETDDRRSTGAERIIKPTLISAGSRPPVINEPTADEVGAPRAGPSSPPAAPPSSPIGVTPTSTVKMPHDHVPTPSVIERTATDIQSMPARGVRAIVEQLPGTTGILLGVGIGVLASVVFAVVIVLFAR